MIKYMKRWLMKTVLVTGASRGLGRSIALKFAENNYNVVINYNNSKDEAQELEKYIKNNYKVEVLIIKADVSNEIEVKKMFNEIINKFNSIDIVVNNAGIAIDTIFEDKTIDNFHKILDTNLIGTFLVSKYASKYMLEKKEGNIINISSTNGIDTYYPYSMDYDASKAGVISLTKNLSKELSPYIRVNCVCPGWINTDMNKELDKDYIEEETKKINLKRFAEPIEIANVVYFLASDEASYVNGSILIVDGGK